MPVEYIEPISDPGEPHYATVDQVREALGVDAAALPDAKAIALLEQAEDLVDRALGARPVDQATGRKVVAGDVDDWRFRKVTRATLIVAAEVWSNPEAYETRRARKVSGPDFAVDQVAEVAGTSPFPVAARTALVGSGLVQAWARLG